MSQRSQTGISASTIVASTLLPFLVLLLTSSSALGWNFGYVQLSTFDSSRARTVTFTTYYPSLSAAEGSGWDFQDALPLFVFAGAKDVLPDAYRAYRFELASTAVMVLLTTPTDSATDDESLALDMVAAAHFMREQNIRSSSIFYKNISAETYCGGFSIGASAAFIAAEELQTSGLNINGIFAIAPIVSAKSLSSAAATTARTMIVCGSQDCKAAKSPNIDKLYDRSTASCKTLCNLVGGTHCRFIHNDTNCRSREIPCKDGNIPGNAQEFITTQYLSRFMFNNFSLPFSKPLQGYESIIKIASTGAGVEQITIIPSKTRACVGDTIVFHVDATLGSYYWMPGGITTPTYTTIAQRDLSVSLTVPNACYDVVFVKTIEVAVPTPIHFQPFEDICAGGTAHIGVANSANYSSFAWSTGETSASITVSKSGDYSVRAFDPSVCAEFIDTVRVHLQESERTQLKTQVLVPTCDIQHTVQVTSGYQGQKNLSLYKLQWSTGDTTQSIILSKDGSYDLWFNAFQPMSNCAISSDTIQYIVHTIYASKPTITKLGQKLHAPKALLYQWRLNGTDIDGATNQEYFPLTSGRYSVMCSFDSLSTCTKTSDLIDFASDVIDNNASTGIISQFSEGQLRLISADELARVRITDLLGQLRIDQIVHSQSVVVNCNSLDPGLYFAILDEGKKWLRIVIP